MRVAIVFNSVFPYRTPVFDRLGKNYTVIYSCQKEGNRGWEMPELKHNHVFLKERSIRYAWEGFYHVNLDIFKALRKVDPDVVVLYGFGLTMQMAYYWARLHRRKIVVMFDGWSWTERNRTRRQLAIQRMFFSHAESCISASHKGGAYAISMGGNHVYFAPLAVDNERFKSKRGKREFDCIYVAQLIERKCAMFIPEVMRLLPGKRLLIIGDGPLKDRMLSKLTSYGVDSVYIPFVSWDMMHLYYQRAKVCLMPTLDDSWGIVANEALASGCPVITTKNAGCACELVKHEVNGWIMPTLDFLWALGVITDCARKACVESVKPYTFDAQAQGIRDACEYAGRAILYRETRLTYEAD